VLYWSLTSEDRAKARFAVINSIPTSVDVVDRGGLEWALASICLMLLLSLVGLGFVLQSVIVSADSRAAVLFFAATVAPCAMAVRLAVRRRAFRAALRGGLSGG